ncbi:MAG: hypothetical protein HQM10_26390 [Candidatus Riflebacteria bacterium]|nr:hypothetical protein [Candidatus Riflebacteria bacterium]
MIFCSSSALSRGGAISSKKRTFSLYITLRKHSR